LAAYSEGKMLDSIEQELEERGMSLEVHTALRAVPTAKPPSAVELPPPPTTVEPSLTSLTTTDVTQPAVMPSAAPPAAAAAQNVTEEEEEEEVSDVSGSSSDEADQAVERPAQRQLSVFEMAMRAFQAEKLATMRARRALANTKPAAARRPSRKVATAPVPKPERPVTVRAEVKPEARADRSEKSQTPCVAVVPPRKPPLRRPAAEGPVEAATSGAAMADLKSRSYPRPWSAHMVAQSKVSDKAGGPGRATVAGTDDARGDMAVGDTSTTRTTRDEYCEVVASYAGQSSDGRLAAVITSSAGSSALGRVVDGGGRAGVLGTRAVGAPASGESAASGGGGEGNVDEGGGDGGSGARLGQVSSMRACDSTDVQSAAVAVRIVGASGEEVAVRGRGAGEAETERERSDKSVVEDREAAATPPLPPPPSRRELAVAAVAARAARAAAGVESDGDDSLDEEDTMRSEADDHRGVHAGGIGWIQEDSAPTHPAWPAR
jgi:hypothetical protein